MLHGDAPRLLQVLVNLISNAAKFTHEGEVKLSVGGRPVDDGQYCLQVDVVDSGIGMPANKLETIFDAFQQVAPERIINKGVGLGLAISKRLVDAMGGELTVSSVEGQGSHFHFEVELPRVAVAETDSSLVNPGGIQPYRVLLVDDDPINRLAVGSLLKQQGLHVVEADNGRIAIECMGEPRFDVVLMDVHMPEMDGVEATRLIRASNDLGQERTAIIGLTASVMSDERQSYLRAGMDAVEEKPVVREALLSTITRCVNERAQQPPAEA
jgi:CheY-like chemotaxis protein/anti-sigma regulatory factor (Ser/Thr protein kinase)